MSKGIDYSFARPDIAAIAAEGNEFVMRYIPYPGDGGKGIDADEIVALRAAGLAIGFVWETVAARHMQGFAAGQADGVAARIALARLGVPDSVAVYFAVDFDASGAQFAAIDDYQRGAATALGIGRVGVYGSYSVVQHCWTSGTAAWLWQTYAWSSGQRFTAHLYQYRNDVTVGGGAVDLNASYGGDQGLWSPEEDELSAEDKERLTALETRCTELEGWRAQILQQLFDDDSAPMVDAYVEGSGSNGLLTLNDVSRRLRTLESAPAAAAGIPPKGKVPYHTHGVTGPQDVDPSGGDQ